MPKNNSGNETLRTMGIFVAAGMEIAIPVVAGALAGSYLDGKFDLSPLFTVILTGLGTVAGFLNLWRLLKRANKDDA
jgi:F0F1-type ATP synthase assembly protein I